MGTFQLDVYLGQLTEWLAGWWIKDQMKIFNAYSKKIDFNKINKRTLLCTRLKFWDGY